MSEKYTYNKKVNSEVLTLEIQESDIIIALDCINSYENTVDVFFKAPLSGSNETLLTTIVNNHNPNDIIKAPPIAVTVVEEDKPTGGHFKSQTFAIDIGADVGWYENIFTFPYRIGLLSSTLQITSEHIGNTFQVYVADGMIVGALTNDAKAGDTTIYVQKSVIDNLDIEIQK